MNTSSPSALRSALEAGQEPWETALTALFNDGQTLAALAGGVLSGGFPVNDDGPISWSEWLIDRVCAKVATAVQEGDRTGCETPVLDALSAEFATWATRNGFQEGDAQELLMREDLSEDQRAWLSDFVRLWETASRLFDADAGRAG